MSKGKPTPPSVGPDAGVSCNGTTQPCPQQQQPAKKAVKVTIALSAPVACPGHPLAITATGDPAGGTYAWTVAGGGAELVDGAGTPISTGPSVNLRSFRPDDTTGKIPAQNATVSVTYTHPDGTATDSKPVPIHAIDFEVTDTAVTAGLTRANEGAGSVTLGNAPGVATMSTDPKVKIKLDASCPRKAACAANHQVGMLQTVLTNDRRTRYTHTLIEVTVKAPIRDGDANNKPYYDMVATFANDGDKKAVHHEDSPGQGATWTDPRPGAPAPPPPKHRQLRQVFFSNGFRAWLVARNLEWSGHHKDDSFIFLRNFDWSVALNVTVDMTQAVGARCTPASNPPTIGAVGVGKGGGSPNLADSYPNVDHQVTTNPAPAL